MEQMLGPYRILSELGRGGMGVVYKGFDDALQRPVAIKVLAEQVAHESQFVARFKREAQSAAKLNHPNIVQIYFIGEQGGKHFFVMEFVEGRSLAQVLRGGTVLAPPAASEMIRQAASGLAAAHDRGVIHRDIKPANLMLCGNGQIKIADFGLATMPEEAAKLTATGNILGTPGYLSPEQCMAEPLDCRTDIYSLGITYYEMLSGGMPFKADSPFALVRQVVEVLPADITQVNPAVDAEVAAILRRMIAKKRDDRYPDCHQVLADLNPYLAAHGFPSQAGLRSTPSQGTASTRVAGGTGATTPPAAPAVGPARLGARTAEPARSPSTLAAEPATDPELPTTALQRAEPVELATTELGTRSRPTAPAQVPATVPTKVPATAPIAVTQATAPRSDLAKLLAVVCLFFALVGTTAVVVLKTDLLSRLKGGGTASEGSQAAADVRPAAALPVGQPMGRDNSAGAATADPAGANPAEANPGGQASALPAEPAENPAATAADANPASAAAPEPPAAQPGNPPAANNPAGGQSAPAGVATANVPPPGAGGASGGTAAGGASNTTRASTAYAPARAGASDKGMGVPAAGRPPSEPAPPPPPLPLRPRILVLATGEPLLADAVEKHLLDGLRAAGLDVIDEAGVGSLSDLRRQTGDAPLLAELAPLAGEHGIGVAVLARIEPLGQRELNYLGRVEMATTARVKINAFLTANRRGIGPGWSPKIEYTALNAEARAGKAVDDASDEIANTVRDGWAAFRAGR